MNENLIKLLSEQKIFPILRSTDPSTVSKQVEALLNAGIKTFEINVENLEMYKVIDEISNNAIVCAGGIITTMQAQAAIQSGAKFISSPIFHMNLVKLSKDTKVPYVAGTSTANEAYQAWKARVPLVKIYPIEAMGGAKYLANILRTMHFLNVMAQGDVKLVDVKSYIDAGAVAVGVGRDLFEGYSYADITSRLKDVMAEL